VRPIHDWRLACLKGESKSKPSGSETEQSFDAESKELYINTEDRTQALRAANRWWREMSDQREREYDLVPALASLLTELRVGTDSDCKIELQPLLQHGATRRDVQNHSLAQAACILCDLGLRALGSLHVEGVQRAFLNLGMMGQIEPGFAERVRRLREETLADMEREAMHQLAAYALKTPLRSADPDTLYAANAVVAATGLPCDADLLVRSATTLQQLLQICRPFMLPTGVISDRKHDCLPSWETVRADVERLFWSVRDEGLDITLLPPVPPLRRRLPEES
jgi:hypothetical protein